MKYAGYHVDGSKAAEFEAAARAHFDDAEFVKDLQEAMINLDRETMSFDIAVVDAHPTTIALAKQFGTGINSYA